MGGEVAGIRKIRALRGIRAIRGIRKLRGTRVYTKYCRTLWVMRRMMKTKTEIEIVEKAWAKIRALHAKKAPMEKFDEVIEELKQNLAQARKGMKKVVKND